MDFHLTLLEITGTKTESFLDFLLNKTNSYAIINLTHHGQRNPYPVGDSCINLCAFPKISIPIVTKAGLDGGGYYSPIHIES